MVVEKGDTVKVEYEGRFEDGEVFDSSKREGKQHPIEFTVGSGQVVQGFDAAVIGMKEGEEKEVTIKPEDAYGAPKPELTQDVPRNLLPQDKDPEEGMKLVMQTPDGQQALVSITKVSKETVTLDMNHPLAGKTLIFKLKVVSVEKAKK